MNCHCGGDIDDCEFDGTIEQMRCRHCEGKDDDDDYDPNDEQQGGEPMRLQSYESGIAQSTPAIPGVEKPKENVSEN